MKIILSIKPKFAEKIFKGQKKFEFRRSIFRNKNVTHVVVYASAPISKIIGEFEIENILYEELEKLWSITKKYSGITEDYYREYFKEKEQGYAIKIKNINTYKDPVCIKKKFGVSPPQSFAYIK